MKKKANSMEKQNLRYNLLITIIYIIGIVLLVNLFTLQIINGAEYREQSNVRLTREATLQATRGSILDRTGNKIATTYMGFSLELYKTKIDTQELNQTILNIVNVLEKNNDTYVDNFPIFIGPFRFTFQDEEKELKWKEENKISNEATAEECFSIFIERYRIIDKTVEEARKIMSIRYELSITGYSSTKGLQISKDISSKTVQEFSERSTSFPGIAIVTEPIRNYEVGSLASHIIGYTGRISAEEYDARKDKGYNANSHIGKVGIESMFEEYLKGVNGEKQIDMGVDGAISGEYIIKPATSGSDVVLTIDLYIQAVAEQALRNNIQKIASGGFGKVHNANSGAVVVMNVKTGEVLAMASYPDFDPSLFVKGISIENWNMYNNSPQKPLYNRALQGTYAPGSIFKMVTAVTGLETGAITLTERIQDRGVYIIDPTGKTKNPHCWIYDDWGTTHGSKNVSGAIQHSCNYFFYEVGRRAGIDAIEKYAHYFGLGEKTGIELPSEAQGTTAKVSVVEQRGQQWSIGSTLSAAIGQSGNDFTPLQIAKYISMICNGGKNISPTIIKTIINQDGSEVSKQEIEEFKNQKFGTEPKESENLEINPEYLKNIMEGMRSVTSETGGTAYARFIDFPIKVGGKTGSAEAPNNKVNAWFVGFAPFDNPEIAVVVLVENGGQGNFTSEVAMEVFKEYFGMSENPVVENMQALPIGEFYR